MPKHPAPDDSAPHAEEDDLSAEFPVIEESSAPVAPPPMPAPPPKPADVKISAELWASQNIKRPEHRPGFVRWCRMHLAARETAATFKLRFDEYRNAKVR
jgi:hypothetical protein